MGHDESQLRFFQQRKAIRYPRPSGESVRSIDTENVDGLIACIVGEGRATPLELRTVYTLEDAMNLFEIIMVRRSNEYLSAKQADANAKRR